MDKTERDNIIMELRLMEDFLRDCDNGLADEIGGRDKISGRIFACAKDLAEIRRELEIGAKP